MRSYPFSEPSAFNSSSFVSTVISSSFYHRLSFPLMIKLVTPVGNWGKAWIHSVSFLFLYVLHCWRALALFPQALQDQFQFFFGSTKNTSSPFFFFVLVLFPIFVQIYSLSYVSLSSLVWSRNLSSRILSCLGCNFWSNFWHICPECVFFTCMFRTQP